MFLLVFGEEGPTRHEPTKQSEAMSEPTSLPVAVSAHWLRAHRDRVIVVDTRWYLDGRSGHEAYLGGHLPGAVFADVDTDLSAPASREGGRHPLPSPETFAASLGALGIGDDTAVVAYDDAAGSVAARLVWMLRALGGSAAILDGGIQAWGDELEEGTIVPEPVHRTPLPWPQERIADTETVRAQSGDPNRLLLDARAYGRYTGEEPAPWMPAPVTYRGTQRRLAEQPRRERLLAAPEVLRARFAALGTDTATTTTAYCGSGVTACHTLLALEHAGYGHTRLYPGSWSRWGGDDSLPVETGSPDHGPRQD